MKAEEGDKEKNLKFSSSGERKEEEIGKVKLF